MRLGMFDDASRPQRVPGRWLSFYLLGRNLAETHVARYVRQMGSVRWSDGTTMITDDKGAEA